jgi:hypothetical protein
VFRRYQLRFSLLRSCIAATDVTALVMGLAKMESGVTFTPEALSRVDRPVDFPSVAATA